MTDLLVELAKMTGPQWTASLAAVAAMVVVGIGVVQGLFSGEARAQRDRRELAEIEQVQRLREQGLHR